MSSSNVIKSSSLDDHSITGVRFEVFDGRVSFQEPLPDGHGFVAYAGLNVGGDIAFGEILREEEQSADPVPEEAQLVVAELQPCITEEELNARAEEAYERGFEEGRSQAERGLSNVFKALREAIEEVNEIRGQVLRHSEEDLLKLSILVARKIIQQEVSLDRRILSNVVTAAIDNASERDELIIRLNPDDLKLVNSQKQMKLAGIGEDRLANLKPDDTIPSGGCIVETQMGEIDARLEKQLDEIYKQLTEDRVELIETSWKPANGREPYAQEES